MEKQPPKRQTPTPEGGRMKTVDINIPCGLGVMEMKHIVPLFDDHNENWIPREVYIKHGDTYYHGSRVHTADEIEEGGSMVLDVGERLITNKEEQKERLNKLIEQLGCDYGA